MAEDGSADGNSAVHPLGTTASVGDVQVTLSAVDESSHLSIGYRERETDLTAAEPTVLRLQITNGSNVGIQLPDGEALCVPGQLVHGQAGHHLSLDGTVYPSYLRLTAAYGDAVFEPGMNLSGVFAYVSESDGPESTAETVAVELSAPTGSETKVLEWEISSPSTQEDKRTDSDTHSRGPTDAESETPLTASDSKNTAVKSDTAVTESLSQPTSISKPSTEQPTESDAEEPSDHSNPTQVHCPECGATARPSHTFCGNCGTPL